MSANLNRENLQDFEEWNYIKDVAKAEGWIENGRINTKIVPAQLGIDYWRLVSLRDTFEGTSKELQQAVKKGKISH